MRPDLAPAAPRRTPLYGSAARRDLGPLATTSSQPLSLGRSIDAGIAAAEFGTVVLSPHFVAKDWPRCEFDAQRQRRSEQADRLITLWHALRPAAAPEWAQGFDPATRLDADAQSVTALTMRILERVRPDLAQFTQRRLAHMAMLERQQNGQARTRCAKLNQRMPGPRRCEQLPVELVGRVRQLAALQFEVDPHSMKYWLDGFLRDLNSEREIAHMQHAAAMHRDAAYAVDVLQQPSQEGASQLLGCRASNVDHRDVYGMLNSRVHRPKEHSRVAEL